MSICPLEDRLLVRPIKKTESEKTEAGIIIDMKKKDVAEGEVVAIGDGYTARDTGLFIPTLLHKGDIILYGKTAGVPIEIENGNGKEEVLLMRENEVLLLIKKSE